MRIVSTRSESGHGRHRVTVVKAALFLKGLKSRSRDYIYNEVYNPRPAKRSIATALTVAHCKAHTIANS